MAGRLLDERYAGTDGLIYLTGVQALVRLPLDVRRADARAGRNTAAFISGYEGSPLAGYDLALGRERRLLDEHQIVFQPGVNEELAATAVQGSQLAGIVGGLKYSGVTGYWYGKAPGLDRAGDALRHNNLMGTHPNGGALAFVGDDAVAKSSTVPSSSEMALADLGMPVVSPADPQGVLDLGQHAVAMSRVSGLWVAVKMATNVADGAATAQVHPDRIVPVLPDLVVDGSSYLHRPTGNLVRPTLDGLEASLFGPRIELARRYAAANGLNRITARTAGDRIGFVAAGKTYLDLRQALRMLGLDDAELARRGVRLLELGMVHPLEPSIVDTFAAGLAEIVVVEEKRPFIETAVKDRLYGRPDAPLVTGKLTPDGRVLLPRSGELDPDIIAKAIATRLGDLPSVQAWQEKPKQRARISLPLLARTPFYCSGCPHNSSTQSPDGSLVGAGIGCHAMVLVMDSDKFGNLTGVTQMGGEGAQWIGMAPFLEHRHLVQNLGDGTFHHSGSLALRATVAAGVNVTYKLLYNSAVAMTGGQQAAGVRSIPEICRMLLAEGVKRIIVTTEDPKTYKNVWLPTKAEVWQRRRLAEAQETLAKVPGVTVLIHDQECATELRRKRKRGLAPDPTTRVMINERVCEGCGDCGDKSNCMSVQPVDTEFGRKTQIHQPSCNKDYSCLAGDCPSFLTVEPGAGRPKPVAADLTDDLPEPEIQVSRENFAMRITGVGGTGVVTLSQVLGAAAVIAGRHVRGLDQLGLAQKGGAVVSDLKLSEEPMEVANKLAAGECDLYLGADLLVAADPKNLAAASPQRTVAVVSTTRVPTGKMIMDTGVTFPDPDGVLTRIGEASRAEKAVYVDARGLAESLFGDDQYANMLLVGAAYQAGCLPLPADALEQAIELNGVKVEANKQAFRRGRQAVADPAALKSTVDGLTSVPDAVRREEISPLTDQVKAAPGSALRDILAIRVPDLVAYQNEAYAKSYVDFVERVRQAEEAVGSTELTETVARNLYKLMAYKDEYEVARLSLDPALRQEITARFGPGARHAYKLHPPILRALGMKRKITLGATARPAFSVLKAMRKVRGTPLDVFGYAHVRRVERALIAEYREAVEETLDRLGDGHVVAVEIAGLPDLVRGYEQIKLANVERYRERLTELRAKLATAAS
ncbi:indolepyruvate ferredoxin oxidoreductase family protein [Fodinicola acaciae]|uniref:indolepyruvate ferredoxin oxidoreductase family protein n=1 Tax=Fodinicola acaciae TaxID=2681555 RepID=UPI0013D18088|nr:indolepyruvate ferredoxin oxidoreductase family protein [Fodinicola acaciae]